ncbi:hypothetical protein [Nitrobacter sp. JJSN]|uniref:hypothetical protein n=1 Tax=Nitrobacter sp. JJSN TaxID=3453033 RepID=UPI003F76B5A9
MTLKVNHFAHGVLLGDYLRTALDVLRAFHPNDGLLGNQESKHAPPAGATLSRMAASGRRILLTMIPPRTLFALRKIA